MTLRKSFSAIIVAAETHMIDDGKPYCECCGRGVRPKADLLAEEVERLRQSCRAAGHLVTPDDRVREETAAALLGLAVGTLRNWAYSGSTLPFTTVARRRTYRLEDLAALLLAE